MIECLYLYKKTGTPTKSISDILHSVSALEGLEYYSPSRGKMRTLYEKSYMVKQTVNSKGKATYERIDDDMTVDSAFILQKDLSFGEHIYENTYYKGTDGSYGFTCVNQENLWYSIVKVLNAKNMNIGITIVDLGDYLLTYVNTRANCTKMSALRNKLQNSFSARAEAIYGWFIKEYEK